MSEADSRADSITEITPSRRWILAFLERARQTRLMHSLADVDVTEPLARIASHERLTGERISLNAFFIRCVARTVERYPEVNRYLLGRRKMIQFHDVDISTIIDHVIDGRHVPMAYVLRAAQSKSIATIQAELEEAAARPEDPMKSGVGMRLYSRLPGGLQRFIWRWLTRDPRYRKKLEGTVLVSNVTTFNDPHVTVRALAPSGATLAVLFVNIARRPWVVGDQVVPREILHFTAALDHRILDGSIMVGLRYLVELLESGSELPPIPTDAGDRQAASGPA
jgi:pyruvate/2-oxoglutarate dehydrogenase complex dihydrolipoamide acyltransferase (E2) component